MFKDKKSGKKLRIAIPEEGVDYQAKKEFLEEIAKRMRGKLAMVDFTEHADQFMDVPSIAHAKALVEDIKGNKRIKIAGPMDYYSAVLPQAAEVKGLEGEVKGDADILFMPDYESGVLLKEVFLNWDRWGLPWKAADNSYGALVPVLVPSRSDTAEHKFRSIISAACLVMKQRERFAFILRSKYGEIGDFLMDIVPVQNQEIDQLRQRIFYELTKIFGDKEIEAVVNDDFEYQGEIVRNLVVKISGEADLPKILLNAHMDIWQVSHPCTLISGKERFNFASGALDDTTGIVAIVEAVRILKKKKVQHGGIWLIFTDKEEEGCLGAMVLVDSYSDMGIFKHADLIISVDGPLNYRNYDIDLQGRHGPCIVGKVHNLIWGDQRLIVLRNAFEEVKAKFRYVRKMHFDRLGGTGDHKVFASTKDRNPVILLRSPYTGAHEKNQRMDIDRQLIPMATWLSEIIIELNRDRKGTGLGIIVDSLRQTLNRL